MSTDNFDENHKNSDMEDLDNVEVLQEGASCIEADCEENKILNQLTEQVEASEDKYKRLYADFENIKRRAAKDRLDLIYSANEKIIKNILPIIDDFERAISAVTEAEAKENFYSGIKLIHNKLAVLLSQSHVETMVINPGDDFNPDLHEAITSVKNEDPSMKNKIVEVIEKGYSLNEKVLRFAKVIIATA